MIRNLIVLFINSTLLASCISVNLKPEEPGTLDSLVFEMPKNGAFKPLNLNDNHHHFQSQATGNLISIQTHCPSNRDNLIYELTNSLQKSQVQSQPLSSSLDERIPVETYLSGYKESIAFKIRLVQYEKLGCKISAFYMAKESDYALEESQFDRLILSLRAQK